MSSSETSVIKRQTVTRSVAAELRRRIVRGDYAGGDPLRQEALAAELGVSRVPVREAFLQLEAEGLVVIHTHKGAVVTALTVEDAIDLFEARLAVEPMVLEKAIGAATPEAIAGVRSALVEYERALDAGSDPETLSRLNWNFHTAMCEPSQRTRMLNILQSLYTATDRYLGLQIKSPAAKTRAMEEHRMLFHAYRAKDTKVAVELIKAHISGAYDDVLGHLQAP